MPRVSKLTLLLLVLLAATVSYSLGALGGTALHSLKLSQNLPPSKDRQGDDSRFRVVDYEARGPVEEVEREARKNKNKRYDNFGLVKKHSPPDIHETIRDVRWQEGVAALPAGQSACVVVGEVQAVATYLSNDKSGVYTEVSLNISEVLKDDVSKRLTVGDVITADRPGGIVRYPNGHRRTYRLFGMNIPVLGGKYLLFLTRDEQSPSYRILTGYELNQGGVSPLDVGPRFDTYKGADQAVFLSVVRRAAGRR